MTEKGRQLPLFDVQGWENSKTMKEEKLTLRYNLFDLPTAQHKAGLAGLLVMIESLKRRGAGPLPEVSELGATEATITVTRQSLQVLLDDLFAAEVVEVLVKNKWQNKKPKEVKEIEVEEEGKKKKEKRFLYDIIQPKGLFLKTFFPDSNDGWIQLWRNMLWNILRAQPATRKIYEEMVDSQHSSISSKIFPALAKENQKKGGNYFKESIAGSVFVGAQEKNAELVSFVGRPSHNFLLHFWHIVSFIFIPRTFTFKRAKDSSGKITWNDQGFTLVIPEPSDLPWFKEDIIEAMQRLNTELAGKSNKPRQAMIDLSEEGGLEYLYHLAKYRTQQQGIDECISCVEVYHVQRVDKNVRMLAANRLIPDQYVLDHYERIRSRRMNPIFKSIVLPNILNQTPWYLGSMNKLASFPVELLVQAQGRTPANMPCFSRDARKKFTDIQHELKDMEEAEMKTEEGRDALLAGRLYNMIRQYIRFKAEKKSGVELKNHKKEIDGKVIYEYPGNYREAVEKVSMDAFLAMRGRRDQDFVEYFTGAICSIPHFLPQEEYHLVAGALLDDWEKVKSLSMLAISAASYLPGAVTDENNNNGEKS